MTQPAMTESEYAARFTNASRADLLRLCRAAGLAARRLKTNEALIHLLWLKEGRAAAVRYTERVNEALRNLGCVTKGKAAHHGARDRAGRVMANEAKPQAHTPGPWTVGTTERPNKRFIIYGDERRIPIAELDADDNEARGNACLIAAAPETAAERDRLREVNAEMLAALREVLREIDACVDDGSLSRDAVEHTTAIMFARAAIAKAEGTS